MASTLSWSGYSTGGGDISDSSDDDPFPTFLPLEQTLGYSAYESSAPDDPFSTSYLARLTIHQSIDTTTQIPPILPDNTLRLVDWSQTIPGISCFLLTESLIPSLKDVRIFLGDMPAKFAEGYRSVIVEAQGRQ
jgi:hypothetical protein